MLSQIQGKVFLKENDQPSQLALRKQRITVSEEVYIRILILKALKSSLFHKAIKTNKHNKHAWQLLKVL